VNYSEAINIVTEAVLDGGVDHDVLRGALEALAGSEDIAPKNVCDELGITQGSTWGDVVNDPAQRRR
jgi:hypothetical protein